MEQHPVDLDFCDTTIDSDTISTLKRKRWRKVWLNNTTLNDIAILRGILGHTSTHLALGYNSLTTICGIQVLDLSNLSCLYLYNNSIISLQPLCHSDICSLQFLFLESNLIEDIEPLSYVRFRRLSHLILSDNRIRSIEPLRYMDVCQLQNLSLQNNRIADIQDLVYVNLGSLKRLALSGNLLIPGQLERIRGVIGRHNNRGAIIHQ